VKSILVTGGSGTFGREFTRRLLDTDIERICIYSRGEYAQYLMRKEFNDDSRLRYFIGDVRDQSRLRRAMEGVDYVVSAAALKRIETCEYNVIECVETNIRGTENVVNAAIDAGVKKAVLLNTDKSVNPTTTYGISKAIAERIFLGANHYAGPSRTKFSSCLYGNIAGSRGSVIPIFRKLIEDGQDTMPVTNPDATRFWMYAHEACDLVLKSFKEMTGGEVFIPELPAYRLGDLVEAMGVKMKIIGMAEHEKIHEEMRPGETSEKARRMTVNEIREALKWV
jgi:UDP-N-acetylglucosamine 4,6-dehydratase/5-epimerase